MPLLKPDRFNKSCTFINEALLVKILVEFPFCNYLHH